MEDIKFLKNVFIVCAALFTAMLVGSIASRDGFSAFMWAVLAYACIRMNVSLTNKEKEMK